MFAAGRNSAWRRRASRLLPIGQSPAGAWLCERYSSRAPHELVRFDLSSGAMVEVSRTKDHLAGPGMRFTPAKPYRWRSVDGMEIAGWLYEPEGREPRPDRPCPWRADLA